jgi:predicted PhzF superfamily epimerase YddE/YHI9
MRLPLYQIDAFASKPFTGNPAAVCPLERWLDDRVMQAVAAENNLSETAFFVGSGDRFELRWFTPTVEVDLCGHATLASGHVILNELASCTGPVRFSTRSGELVVSRGGEMLTMDLPAHRPSLCEPPPALAAGLGREPELTLAADHKYLAVFESEAAVRALAPDLRRLTDCHPFGVIVTAPGESVDFVSRYFAPSYGVDEDPVTGSAHCVLAPYWAERTGKRELAGYQASRRGGEVFCRDVGDRVAISGGCVRYFTGTIEIPD